MSINGKIIYRGKFKPRNPQKYSGNPDNIVYRSSWELAVCSWLDKNDFVQRWSSEETVLKYMCPTDNKVHRYFLDFTIQFRNGDIHLIEIKPAKQTVAPVSKRGKNKKRLLSETLTYMKNQAKWEAATSYAKRKGYKFSVWTENTLKQLGIKLYGV